MNKNKMSVSVKLLGNFVSKTRHFPSRAILYIFRLRQITQIDCVLLPNSYPLFTLINPIFETK